MIRTHGLTHISIGVSDMERSLEFYQRVFGMVAIYRGEDFIQAQTPGSRDVLVFQQRESQFVPNAGVSHFGFSLVDPKGIEGAAETVEKAGGRVLRQGVFCPGEPYLFFLDPDGYEVELWFEIEVERASPRRDTESQRNTEAQA
ncbi:MAG: VOC family protein [Gemmatimonadota bacterium]|nr:VOC family protein [Gemmatimonadota bacterium]